MTGLSGLPLSGECYIVPIASHVAAMVRPEACGIDKTASRDQEFLQAISERAMR